jgi:hypothetical protein
MVKTACEAFYRVGFSPSCSGHGTRRCDVIEIDGIAPGSDHKAPPDAVDRCDLFIVTPSVIPPLFMQVPLFLLFLCRSCMFLLQLIPAGKEAMGLEGSIL